MKRMLGISALLTLWFFLETCSQAPPPTQGPPTSSPVPAGAGAVVEIDPAIRAIVPVDTKIEKLADGFAFIEGPIWINEENGALLFSDIPRNQIMKWTLSGTVAEFRKPSGYTGPPEHASAYSGSNGLTHDKQGRLIICEHGDRRVTRLEKNG